MTTLKVTKPTNKPGELYVFTIQFSILDFDNVVEAVSNVKTVEELFNSSLWKVI